MRMTETPHLHKIEHRHPDHAHEHPSTILTTSTAVTLGNIPTNIPTTIMGATPGSAASSWRC